MLKTSAPTKPLPLILPLLRVSERERIPVRLDRLNPSDGLRRFGHLTHPTVSTELRRARRSENDPSLSCSISTAPRVTFGTPSLQ